MKATTSLRWTATFLIGVTLASCRDLNFENYLDSHWLQETSSSFKKQIPKPLQDPVAIQHESTKQNDDNALAPDKFSLRLANILKPDIFSQSNPLVYLLNKIVNSSDPVIGSLSSDVKFLLQSNQFPPQYIPYAKILLPFFDCQSDLKKLRRSISTIEYLNAQSSSSSSSFTLPVEFATSELSAFFSPDIFSDPNIPSVIFNKIVDIPKHDVLGFVLSLLEISSQGSLPRQYASYAKALASFMRNTTDLDAFRQFNCMMKHDSIAPTK